MYHIPGYVDYYEEGGAIYVTSRLRQNTVKLSEPQIIEEFKAIAHCGGCPEIFTPLGHFLHEQELLVTEQEINDVIDELRKIMNDSLLLTIMPTEGCNFRCSYCYEDHASISMCRDTIDQIKKYLCSQAASFQNINISWFGGEPTLCKDTIIEVNSLAQMLQKNYQFDFTSSMTTNGYLLSCEDFLKYYHSGITSYQITLDGWCHDKTRPHISGKGSLQRILDNLLSISVLPNSNYQYHVTLRHNILPGDEDYSWYDHLHTLFGKDDRFSVLVRPVGNWGGESVRSLDVLKGNDRDILVQKHIDYMNKIGLKCGNQRRSPLSQVCYASYPHSMVFRSNGKIEKCTICLDHPDNLLGYVDQEKGVTLNATINQLWSTATPKLQCYQCADMLSCMNMQCPASRIIYAEDSNECQHTRPKTF